MTTVEIAEVCHEVNRSYCQSIGDNSQPSWNDAPAWQRDSAIAGVKVHRVNPDMTPAESHESWLSVKKAEGWTWGPKKDPARKEHPCYVPYDLLPQEQRSKDYIFKAIVAALGEAQ